MMKSMTGDPPNGSSLEGHGTDQGECVFEQSWDSKAAVGDQAVVTQTDSESTKDYGNDEACDQSFPREDQGNQEAACMDKPDPEDFVPAQPQFAGPERIIRRISSWF
jgi:hypothetical protein